MIQPYRTRNAYKPVTRNVLAVKQLGPASQRPDREDRPARARRDRCYSPDA